MTTPAVTFSYATWTAQYPEFAGCSPTQGQAWFDRADLYCANETCSRAYLGLGATRFALVLYMLTSHIGWLSAPRDPNGNPASSGSPPPGIVGRISSAGEGSVNASIEWKGGGSPSEEWFTQTPYGAAYWQAMAQFRTARYVANPTVVPGTGWPRSYGRRRW